MKIRTSSFQAAVLTVTIILLTSCATTEPAEPESSLNQTQAEERIEEYITQAVSGLPGDVETSIVRNPSYPTCEGESGDESHTVSIRHVYWVDGVPEEKNQEAAEALHAYWSTGDWEVVRDERPDKMQLEAKNRGDQFRMNLVINQDGRPSLAVYSPCVQADDKQ